MSDVRILVISPNWLGDSLMAMPAMQALRNEYVDAHLVVLTKSHLKDLWGMHDAPDDVLGFPRGNRGTLSAVQQVKAGEFDRTFVLPNSFRAALIPQLAGVAERIGFAGHSRAYLLTDVREAPTDPERRHQMWEYFSILDLTAGGAFETLTPELRVPAAATASIERLGVSRDAPHRVAIMPGAAHGESKRWPDGHFCDVAASLTEHLGAQIVLLGTQQEAEACAFIAERLPENTVNMAGRTSLAELAAALQACSATVANDSGGMHLAAAVGCPVVGIYGITDPARTGPLGSGNRIVSRDGVERSRDLASTSSRATAELSAIRPDIVLDAVNDILETPVTS